MESENQTELEAPTPPSEHIVGDPPQMSEVATLGNIFFEPGNTFEDLRRKPRFIIGSIIIALLVTAYGFALYYKVGDQGYRRFAAEQMDKSPQTQGMSAEQKSDAIDLQMKIGAGVRYGMPILVFISLLIGGLLYWLGAKAFGGTGTFLHSLSVWVYSTLPPAIVGMIANVVILFFKSVDEIDIGASQRGVVTANPSFLMDGKASPVLATVIATFDLFFIWGWILAAIGLRITNRISSGSAWAIVLILALVGTALRVIGALFSGNVS
ncbi:MAG: YIP1 family protein [Saprospiraceae bacterium]|nr:YIP1 family protein [Pyrinomonadaceae bacterium]